jgi:hypothetical protein
MAPRLLFNTSFENCHAPCMTIPAARELRGTRPQGHSGGHIYE